MYLTPFIALTYRIDKKRFIRNIQIYIFIHLQIFLGRSLYKYILFLILSLKMIAHPQSFYAPKTTLYKRNVVITPIQPSTSSILSTNQNESIQILPKQSNTWQVNKLIEPYSSTLTTIKLEHPPLYINS